MRWLLHVLAFPLRQDTVSALTNRGQALVSTTLVIQRIRSSWVPATLPLRCAPLLAMRWNLNAILVAPAFMTPSAILAGGQVSALTASSMSSRMFLKSTTPYHLAKKIPNVKTALTGSSLKATAATRRRARPASQRALLHRREQRPARHLAGGAVSTSPPRHRRLLPRP